MPVDDPCRLALGADWQPAVCKNAWGAWYGSGCVATQQIADDLSLERLVNKSAAWGLEVKVLTALALQVRARGGVRARGRLTLLGQ